MTTSEPAPNGGSERPQPARGMWPTPMTVNRTSRKAQRERPTAGPQRGGASYGLEDVVTALENGQPDPRLTLFAEDSLASPSPAPAAASPRKTPAGYGPHSPRSFADYDPPTRSWRTFQGSLFAEWETYSATWPRAGMTRNGTAYQRQPSAPLTGATGSGSLPTPVAADSRDNPPAFASANTTRWDGVNSLGAMARTGMWPTPSASDPLGSRTLPPGTTPTGLAPNGKKYQVGLVNAVKLWPTPQAIDGHPKRSVSPEAAARRAAKGRQLGIPEQLALAGTTGMLNPAWVSALMGYPPDWTELD